MKKGSKSSEKPGEISRRKKKLKRVTTYASYVHRILKEIDSARGISGEAMAIMDHFAKDIFDRCAIEAARLTKLNSKRTMTAKEVRTAVRLLLPDELGHNAVLQGNNALEMYNETWTVGMSVGKPTTCKDAIRRWEEENGQETSSATEVTLTFQWPPIEKMDNALGTLSKCEKLSLSTNMIEKIAGVSSLKNLRVLSLGRNFIKSFTGLEALGDTLEELWISYNCIEKMKGINSMRNLRALHMSNNLVREWNELSRLQELPNLCDLLFVGNPLCEGIETEPWRQDVARRLPNLEKLDGEPIIRTEDQITPNQAKTETSDQQNGKPVDEAA